MSLTKNNSGQVILLQAMILSLVALSVITYINNNFMTTQVNLASQNPGHYKDMLKYTKENILSQINNNNAWNLSKAANAPSLHKCFAASCVAAEQGPHVIQIRDATNSVILSEANTSGIDIFGNSCSTYTDTDNTTNCIFRIEVSVKSSCPNEANFPCSNAIHKVFGKLKVSEGKSVNFKTEDLSFTVYKN